MQGELEKVLLRFKKEDMIEYLLSHKELYEYAIELAISDKKTYSWRAAWLLWSCLEQDNKLLYDAQYRIIIAIPSKKDGHQRELLKLLSLIQIEDDYLGLLFDTCLAIWKDISKSPSTRYTAFRMMIQISKKYPDLQNELVCVARENYIEALSPGIKNSIKRMIKETIAEYLIE